MFIKNIYLQSRKIFNEKNNGYLEVYGIHWLTQRVHDQESMKGHALNTFFNKGMVSKDFPVTVKKLFQRSNLLICLLIF